MTTYSVEFHFYLADVKSLTIADQLHQLHRFVAIISKLSPNLARWFMKGATLEEASQYEVFDTAGPTAAASTLLEQKFKGRKQSRVFGFWNGYEGEKEGASLRYLYRSLGGPCSITLEMGEAPSATAEPLWAVLVEVIQAWRPVLLSVSSMDYFDHKVFPDRPGVGWMLYIPRKLSEHEIPEARVLVPVMDGKTQIGSIVISQTEAAFDPNNPDHIAVSNAIEVRLADQDLLPLYSEL